MRTQLLIYISIYIHLSWSLIYNLKKTKRKEKSYLALLDESCTLSLKCFNSFDATGGWRFRWTTPKGRSSNAFPEETPRALFSSPEQFFWLPNVMGSKGKHWGKDGIFDGRNALPRFKLFPDPIIIHLQYSCKMIQSAQQFLLRQNNPRVSTSWHNKITIESRDNIKILIQKTYIHTNVVFVCLK